MLQYSMSLGHCLVSWHFLNPCWNPLTIYNTSDTFVNLFWNPYATFDTSDTSDTTVLWTLTDIQELEFDFLIFKKDWSWSNRSRRSLKKIELLLSISEKDQITLVNLWKRSKRLNRSQKTSDLGSFPPFLCLKIESLPSSIFDLFKDRRDQFVLVDLWKRSTMSESHRIFFEDRLEWFNLFCDRIDLSIFQSQNSIDSIEKPMIKFPTLLKSL